MAKAPYRRFLSACPPECAKPVPVDVGRLEADIKHKFGIHLPEPLKAFWATAGTGYFGKKEICFLGTGAGDARDGLVKWNKHPFWRKVFKDGPAKGGPLFFADTCFGDQIGFQFEGKTAAPLLLGIDTVELFILANDMGEFFERVLPKRGALFDPSRLKRVRRALGPLPRGRHYAPIVSPLVGGTDDVGNFHIEDPVVHVATAIAVWKSTL